MIQHLKIFKALSVRLFLTMIALLAAMPLTSGSVWAAAPLYEVNNNSSNSSIPNSFPAALAYVNANGGTVTFGPGAYGQTCVLGSSSFVSLTHPITINLAGLNLTGFSIDGNLSQGSSYGIQAYAPTPVGLTFTSPSQKGSFIFKNGGYFENFGFGTMTTTLEIGTALSLLSSSIFKNSASGTDMTTNLYGALTLSDGSIFQNSGSGSMTTNVYGTLNLSGRSWLYNAQGSDMTTNIYGSLTLSDASYLVSSSGLMTTTIAPMAILTVSASEVGNGGTNMVTNVYGTLEISNGGNLQNFGSPTPPPITIHSGGLLSTDTSAAFYGQSVSVQNGGIFTSGMGGSTFWGSSLNLSPGATHQTEIGMGNLPVQMVTWYYNTNLINSTATLGGATLNVVSSQNLTSLQGNTYPILTENPGNSILGSYGTQLFNGSSLYLPYELDYRPSPSAITSVNVVFPPANVVRNNAPDSLVPYSFPAALAYANSNGGNVTFGPGAVGQTCTLNSELVITNPLTIDLAGLNSSGFSIGGRYIQAIGSKPASLTFISSSGSGTFSFLNGRFFRNFGAPSMTTTVSSDASLILAGQGSYFQNYYGPMNTIISSGGTLALSGENSAFGNLRGAMTTTVSSSGILTLSGANSYFINGVGDTMITAVSSGGTLSLSGVSSQFLNYGTDMITSVNGTLALSNGSGFAHHGSDDMNTTVSAGGILSLLGSSSFVNNGNGTMTTTVNTRATLTLSGGSTFDNLGSGPMTTTISSGGSLSLLDYSRFSNYGSGSATVTIHSGGRLSMNAAQAALLGQSVSFRNGSTFFSGLRGGFFEGSSCTLSSNAMHQAVIGMESDPVQVRGWNGNPATLTLGGATLNLVSSQNLTSLQGHAYTILTASLGGAIVGQYGTQKFNGSSLYLPYDLDYRPNPSSITSVSAIFPPANVVRNNAADPLVPYSFPAALAYVNINGGNVTFGPGAVGQTCMLGSVLYINNPTSFDLAGLTSTGFSISGGGYCIEALGVYNPAHLTFTSSSGNGNFFFTNGMNFVNGGSGAMTTIINTGATLALSGSSFFYNEPSGTHTTTNVYGALTLSGGSFFENHGSGAMLTTVGPGASLTLSDGSYFQNYGPAITAMITNIYGALALSGGSNFLDSGNCGCTSLSIFSGGSLSLSDNSYFRTAPITANVYGTLTLSDSYFISVSNNPAQTNVIIHSGGRLSLDSMSRFFGEDVMISGGGIFFSGLRGADFAGSSLTLSFNATHQAVIGTEGLPVQLSSWTNNGRAGNAIATLGGAALNVVSPQSLNSLQGNNYTLWTAEPGSSILGQYGAQQFNGSSVNLPYKLYYLPNASFIQNVTVGFPTPTPAPTRTPTVHPTKSPTATPSLFPTHLPSAIMATLVPTATRLIANFTNVTNSSLLVNLTTNFTNGTSPLAPPAGDSGESWENAPYVIGPIVAVAALTISAVGYKVGKWLGWWGKEDATCTSCRKQSRKTDISDTELDASLASSHSAASFTHSTSLDHSEGSLSVNSEKREFHAMAHPLEPENEWGKVSQSQGPLTRAENNSISLQKSGDTVELSTLEARPPIFEGRDPQTPQSSFRAAPIYRAEGELPPLVPLRPLGLGRPEHDGDLVPGF